MPSVLVTGSSRGIGREVALRMAAAGWLVHAGVRRAVDGEALQRDAGPHGERIRPLIIDVTDQATIDAAAAQLTQLDAVVNNAGIVVAGPIEGLALADLRAQLEVNVTGQVAVTQAVLGLLRASQGRIVLIGSVSGRVSTPLLGAYAASKFALEAIADALRVELRPWKIGVSLVEPGSIDTALWREAPEQVDATESALSPEHRELYGAQFRGMRKLTAQIQKRTAPPSKVADAVEQALTAPRPRARYMVGADARAQTAMRALLPTRALDAALARVIGAR